MAMAAAVTKEYTNSCDRRTKAKALPLREERLLVHMEVIHKALRLRALLFPPLLVMTNLEGKMLTMIRTTQSLN